MQRTSFYDQISRNKRDSLLLTIFIVALVVALVFVMARILLPELALFLSIISIVLVLAQVQISYNLSLIHI